MKTALALALALAACTTDHECVIGNVIDVTSECGIAQLVVEAECQHLVACGEASSNDTCDDELLDALCTRDGCDIDHGSYHGSAVNTCLVEMRNTVCTDSSPVCYQPGD